MSVPTPRQLAVLEFVDRHIAEHRLLRVAVMRVSFEPDAKDLN